MFRAIWRLSIPGTSIPIGPSLASRADRSAASPRTTTRPARSPDRLLTQAGRILELNGLEVVTREVVEAARCPGHWRGVAASVGDRWANSRRDEVTPLPRPIFVIDNALCLALEIEQGGHPR